MNELGFRYPEMNTLADVEKVIGGAIEAAKTMKKRVQYAAIGCMILAGKDGKDEEGIEWAEHAVVKANYLVDQLGNGIKGEGLVKFMVYMGGFVVNPADKKSGFIKVKTSDWIRENLEAAKEKAWYDYAPAAPYTGFNLAEQLRILVKKADNAVQIASGDDKKAEKVEVDRDMLDIMSALLNGTPVKAEHALRLVERLIPDNTDVTHDKVIKDGVDITAQVEQPLAVNG